MKQYSTITSLLRGEITGTLSIRELLTWGDFGVGAFHHIDGEMTVLDGVCYQSLWDGRTVIAEEDRTTPFACVTKFSPERTLALQPAVDMRSLSEQLDRALGGRDSECIYAVRIEGIFARISFRSEVPQTPPVGPLSQVMLTAERRFFRDRLEGTLVGTWFPLSMEGLNSPGWHLHVLSKDRTLGGHVLDVGIIEGEAGVAHLRDFVLHLPEPHKTW